MYKFFVPLSRALKALDNDLNIAVRNTMQTVFLMWLYSERRCNNNMYLTAIGLLTGGSGCVHVHIYEKGARNLKPGGLHAEATWSLGNHLSICL